MTSQGIRGPVALPTRLSANWPSARRSQPMTGTDTATLPTCLSANWPGSARPFPDMTVPGTVMTVPGTVTRCSPGPETGSMEANHLTEVQG